MANNVVVTPGSAADPPIATDDVGGVQYQRVKLDVGASGATTPLLLGQGAMAASLPVVVASDQSAIKVTAQGHVLVSGDGIFTIGGNVASDAADAGNPVKIGGIVVVSANPASAAALDRVNAIFDKVGRQVVVQGHVRECVVQALVTVQNAVQTTLLASGGSTIFQDITSLDITNAAATAVTVFIFDGSAAGAKLIYSLAGGGGVAKTFNPPFKQAVADRTWTVTVSPSVANVQYFNIQTINNT